MESEIQFLLKILLEHKLGPEVKKLFLARIGDVENSIRDSLKSIRPQASVPNLSTGQAPSTQRILDSMPKAPNEEPGILVASTAAAMAVQSRQQAILSAGKIEPGATRPRKF